LTLTTSATPLSPTLFPYTTLFRPRRRTPQEYAEGVVVRSRGRGYAEGADQALGRTGRALSLPFPASGRGSPGDVLTSLGHAIHRDRKSTRLNSSHVSISYAVFCLT